jgi:arylformamidase
LSDAELLRHPHLVHQWYGANADEYVVLTGAVSASAPVHVFIHGGYWQQLSWRDAFFSAGGFSKAGVTYGAINYSLTPKLPLPAIVEQCQRAIACIAILSLDAGGSGRLSLSGSSAGAHLAAMLAMTRWTDFSLSHDPIAAFVLVSGIYDLEPLVETPINAALQLSRAEARRLSPLRLAPLACRPTIVCWGEHDTDAFKWQGEAFAHHLSLTGGGVECFQVSGRNHFDIVFDLSDSTTALGAATLGLIERTM